LKPTSFLLTGLLFAALWASASAAAKFGLRSAEPLVLFNIRFFIAGALLLAYAYGVEQQPLPRGRREWTQLAVFGLLNTALYLSLFVLAMKTTAAGIGSLATATNPLFISLLTAFWVGKPVAAREWGGVALGIAGVALATYPLLQNSYATTTGLLLLGGSMISYSIGTIYYSERTWTLSRSALNGWQTILSAVMLLPLTGYLYEGRNRFDVTFWASEFWLVVLVSVLAVQLWLRLLRADAVRASLFLFLCPIFGFAYATLLLGEPFTWQTVAGTVLVLLGLWLGQRRR
jgi:probable blue pigment (indigoidine) exporter